MTLKPLNLKELSIRVLTVMFLFNLELMSKSSYFTNEVFR